MARRRMFSLDVVDTDRFLNLPVSAQNLYFHLGMHADDDGFIASTRTLIRCVGSSNADLETLIQGGFLIAFPSGVYVISHWRINNQIRKDRYKESIYRHEADRLTVDKTGAYTLEEGCQAVDERLPDGCQTVDMRLTDGCQTVNPGQTRLDKDSIDKVRTDKTRTDTPDAALPATAPGSAPATPERANRESGAGAQAQPVPDSHGSPDRDRVNALLAAQGIPLDLHSEQTALDLARAYGMAWFEKAMAQAGENHATYPLKYAAKVLTNWKSGDGAPTDGYDSLKRQGGHPSEHQRSSYPGTGTGAGSAGTNQRQDDEWPGLSRRV